MWSLMGKRKIGVAAGFAPCRVHPHINSTIDQVLKNYPSLADKKKDNIVRTMKQNRRKHVYFSFFNPPKVTHHLSSLRHGTHKAEGDWRTRNTKFRANSVGVKLAMGRNWYHSNWAILMGLPHKRSFLIRK